MLFTFWPLSLAAESNALHRNPAGLNSGRVPNLPKGFSWAPAPPNTNVRESSLSPTATAPEDGRPGGGAGSADCNDNGIPHGCEPDCDSKDLPDGTDIAGGGRGGLDVCQQRRFHRGDPNGDGATELADSVKVFGFLFLGRAAPGCTEFADVNSDGAVEAGTTSRILGASSGVSLEALADRWPLARTKALEERLEQLRERLAGQTLCVTAGLAGVVPRPRRHFEAPFSGSPGNQKSVASTVDSVTPQVDHDVHDAHQKQRQDCTGM